VRRIAGIAGRLVAKLRRGTIEAYGRKEPEEGPCLFRLVLDREVMAELCRRHGVSRLAVFGSAVSGESTLNAVTLVLVEFTGNDDGFTAYFALEKGLETLLSRPVDLVMPGLLRIPTSQPQSRRPPRTSSRSLIWRRSSTAKSSPRRRARGCLHRPVLG